MSADVVKLLAAGSAGNDSNEPQSAMEDLADTMVHQFWTGVSGQRYLHTIYSLIGCPEVPHVNYLIVRRDALGSRKVLAAGHTDDDAPSLNLAEIRQLGAALGGNEVHIHMLAGSTPASKVVAHDLRSAHLPGSLAHVPETHH